MVVAPPSQPLAIGTSYTTRSPMIFVSCRCVRVTPSLSLSEPSVIIVVSVAVVLVVVLFFFCFFSSLIVVCIVHIERARLEFAWLIVGWYIYTYIFLCVNDSCAFCARHFFTQKIHLLLVLLLLFLSSLSPNWWFSHKFEILSHFLCLCVCVCMGEFQLKQFHIDLYGTNRFWIRIIRSDMHTYIYLELFSSCHLFRNWIEYLMFCFLIVFSLFFVL